MKKLFVFLISVITVFLFLCISSAEDHPGIVAKVTTKKGPLKMRESADTKGRVLTEIPNGTCILVLQEDEIWCQVSYQDQPGYCRTEFLTLLREADPAMLEYKLYPGKWTWHFATTPDRRQRIRNMDKQST